MPRLATPMRKARSASSRFMICDSRSGSTGASTLNGWEIPNLELVLTGMDDAAADARYTAGGAAVQALLDAQAELSARLGAAIADVEGLRCRVASEDEDVVAEVDGLQRLT